MVHCPNFGPTKGAAVLQISTLPIKKRTAIQRSGAPDMGVSGKNPVLNNPLNTRTTKNKVVLQNAPYLTVYIFENPPLKRAGWSYSNPTHNTQSNIFARFFLKMSKGLSNDSVSEGKEDLVIPWAKVHSEIGR